MNADKNTVEFIVHFLKDDLISASLAATLADKLIDDIGWDRIPVVESEDGEITYLLSMIEDLADSHVTISDIENALLDEPPFDSRNSPAFFPWRSST